MNQPELGKKIVELRKAKGLTQEELVGICNINIRTLQRIEAGEVNPRDYTLNVIFDALDFQMPDSSNKQTKFIVWTNYLINLFNLKSNTMKKVSLLALLIIIAISFVYKPYVFSQTLSDNPLVGNWKLYAKTVKEFDRKDSIFIDSTYLVPGYDVRYLEFTKNNTFETRTISNELYNSGVYSVVNDSLFVTVHHLGNGILSDVSHLYSYSINGDTLNFKGYYIANVRSCSGRLCEKRIINETWVRE